MSRNINSSTGNSGSDIAGHYGAASELCKPADVCLSGTNVFHLDTSPIKKIRRKSFFTLVEVMISLFIAAILLSVIFRFFSQIITFEKKMKQAREHILETSSLDIKLNTIFSQLIHKNFSKDPCFYTKDNSLCFYFDNGIDPNPMLSSVVMATLLIDKNDDLILKITPTEANNKIFREEILMKHIKNLSFEFTKNLLNQKDPHQSTRFPIFTSWDKEENNIPAIVKIKLQNKNGENLSFDFFLPTEQSSITYFDKAK